MKVTLAKNQDWEFEIELPFTTQKALKLAKREFYKKHQINGNSKEAYGFYLQYLPEEISSKGIEYICRKSHLELDDYIRLYGNETGQEKYNHIKYINSIKGTLQFYVEKYGEVEGKKRYIKKNSKLSVNPETLRKNGKTEEEIKKIRERHSKGSSTSLETYIAKYGEIEGKKKYHKRLENARSHWQISYWTDKGYTENEAKEIISNIQRRDFEWCKEKYGEEAEKKYAEMCENRGITKKKYIEKYGKDIGTKKWNDRIELFKKTSSAEYQIKKHGIEYYNKIGKRKAVNSLTHYIEKYGDIEGPKKYNENCKHLSHIQSLEYHIEKYGEVEGPKKRAEKYVKINQQYSKKSQEFFWVLYSHLKDKYKKIYFAELNQEYIVRTNRGSVRFLDLFIKDINVAIEFDCDYWHDAELDIIRENEIKETLNNTHFIRVSYEDCKKHLDMLQQVDNTIKEIQQYENKINKTK